MTSSRERNRENFKRILEWVQKNIADKCPEVVSVDNIYVGKYRITEPGVLDVVLYMYDRKYKVGEHWYVDAKDAMRFVTDDDVMDFLLNWPNDKWKLEYQLGRLIEKENQIDNFIL